MQLRERCFLETGDIINKVRALHQDSWKEAMRESQESLSLHHHSDRCTGKLEHQCL